MMKKTHHSTSVVVAAALLIGGGMFILTGMEAYGQEQQPKSPSLLYQLTQLQEDG